MILITISPIAINISKNELIYLIIIICYIFKKYSNKGHYFIEKYKTTFIFYMQYNLYDNKTFYFRRQ
jgi:hypothetical protein